MKTIDEYLEEQINEQLCQAILSGSRGNGPSKVKIRPVEIRGKVVYQASETVGTKVLHKNYSREELISYLKAGLQHDFSQLQASGMALDGTILVSKKGKMTIKTRRHPENGKGLAFGKDKTFSKGTQEIRFSLPEPSTHPVTQVTSVCVRLLQKAKRFLLIQQMQLFIM